MPSELESTRRTLRDLRRFKERAELVDGRILLLEPVPVATGLAAGEIFFSLGQYKRATGRGRVYSGRVGYAVPRLPSGRESFSPNASYYDGPLPADRWDFLPGPPTFAVEVRDVLDPNPAAEADRQAKRLDYFAAGTLVVWDVDPKAETVHSYRPEAPERPVTFRQGETADAEPAVPGWRIAVADVFAE